MRILMVSMRSLHFYRWVDQLKYAGHEVFWFDIKGGRTPIKKLSWVKQIINWKNRYQYPGYYFIKNKIPILFRFLQYFNERTVENEFEKVIKETQPDIVHSFALYISCTPIFRVMQKNKHIPWIYSSWGSDLFYFKDIPRYKKDIDRILPRIDYLFTDCKRDHQLAIDMGFQGIHLDVIPGGGGFPLNELEHFIKPVAERKTILVKGYQGRSGRAISVIKALLKIQDNLGEYEILIFGADAKVVSFIKGEKWSSSISMEIISKDQFIPHEKLMQKTGESLIYIGNSNSDGMPNTLLEAICMGAFPIQSNMGGATEEVIKDGVNGFLIKDINDTTEIASHIMNAIESKELLEIAFVYNQDLKKEFDRNIIEEKVLASYNRI